MDSPFTAPAAEPPSSARCAACGRDFHPDALACPSCLALVHRDELTRLAAEAERAAGSGDHLAALVAWRQALSLLPPRSRQHAQVTARVRALSLEVDGVAAPKPIDGGTGKKGLAATVGGALLFLLAKGKLLLVGLTKLSTFTSMAVALGVYLTVFGWRFALGFLLSMYVHEMGHVAALHRFGIAADAPMFIPGLGALVRLKQYPIDPREDARVGLAGPIWGLAAALFAYAVARATGWPSWFAIARAGGWLNLFNLVPIWQLDGGRGFRALTRLQRVVAAAAVGIAWLVTSQGILLLLLAGAVIRVSQKDAPTTPDRRTLVEYVVLVAALSALASLHVPGM